MSPELTVLPPPQLEVGAPEPSSLAVIDVLLDYLEQEGVDTIFGVPGGPLTPFFEALKARGTIKFVLAKHEEAAAFMANTHARVHRRLAVCCVTSGPGATNAVTGVAGALADSLPVLYLTGQVATRAFGRGAIQESTVHGTDVVAILRPVTKLSAMLTSADEAPTLIRNAIRTTLAGRHGPVHLNIPADLAKAKIRHTMPERPKHLGMASPERAAMAEAIDLLRKANAGCILAGHGVSLAGAAEELRTLAESLDVPVATSPKGKGVFPENHPQSLGVLGLGGHARAFDHLFGGELDVLLVVGSSLNEFSSNAWDTRLQPKKALIQIDIDAREIGKNYPVHIGVTGDARAVLHSMNEYIQDHAIKPQREAPPSLAPSMHYDDAERMTSNASPIEPPRLMAEIRAAMGEHDMLFVDNGNSILWGGHYFEVRQPYTYFIDLGMACMGSAVAAVIGGKLARPNRGAVALVGDAAFAMHGMEVHTAVEQKLPVVWVVLNNSGHGMVAQGETLLRGEDLGFGHFSVPLDAAAIGRALGAHGVRVQTVVELQVALRNALIADRPTVIDAIIDPTVMPPTLERRAQSLARFFGTAK